MSGNLLILKALQQDSISVHPAASYDTLIPVPFSDSIFIEDQEVPTSNNTEIIPEQVAAPARQRVIVSTPVQKDVEETSDVLQPIKISPIQKVSDTLVVEKSHIKKDFDRYSFFSGTDSADFAVKPESFLTQTLPASERGSVLVDYVNHHFDRSSLNWILILVLVSISLLLVLKAFYQKFLTQVVATMANFQLAEKILREKNIIVRRAFTMMNINYILIISLFLLLMSIYWQFRITGHSFLDYLIILGIVVGVLLARVIIFYITGFLFEKIPSVNEHLHMIFLVNKNLGLILLPIAFISLYSASQISKIVLFSGITILLFATIYKLIRGFIIIMRSGVFLFYAILYLCTLELLPLVLGSKIIISLR